MSNVLLHLHAAPFHASQDKQGHETTRLWNTLELVAPPVIRRTRDERASSPKSPHDSVNGKSSYSNLI